jgi:hypothetical protein
MIGRRELLVAEQLSLPAIDGRCVVSVLTGGYW